MKIFAHSYSPGQLIVEMVAQAMEGKLDGNFVKGDTPFYKGTHYTLEGAAPFSALLADVHYKEDAFLSYESLDDRFVHLSFIITDLEISFKINNTVKNIDNWTYNMYINDVALANDYTVKKGSNIFSIGIFVEKTALKAAFEKKGMGDLQAEDIFDETKNTLIRTDRISNESLEIINNFRKIPYNSPFFDLHFKSVVNRLFYRYLLELDINKIVIGKVTKEDFENILKSKVQLYDNLEGGFPGIDSLSSNIAMSASKYKKLFFKITGTTPASYFNRNKLHRGKELLESRQFTINEVVNQLNYCSTSYFAKCFKESYGLFPKEYQKLLL